MQTEDAPFVEILSARCVDCGQPIEASDFSSGVYGAWPVIAAGGELGRPRLHRGCGGRIELGEVRPAWHFCDDHCECGSGGLPERAG